MKPFSKLLGIIAIAAITFTACTEESGLLLSDDLEPADAPAISSDEANTIVPINNIFNSPAPKTRSLAIWADCEAFGTIGTPTSFKPTAGNFDELYQANFKGDLGAISDSKPGDKDFNGGRWHVNVLKYGVDPDKYSDVCSADDLDINDFESAGRYFECPLLPARGHGVQ